MMEPLADGITWQVRLSNAERLRGMVPTTS